MRWFYFIGGPKAGYAAEYLQRLAEIGETPAGWRVYPLVNRQGKALHLVSADALESVHAHLQKLEPYCEYSEIIEIPFQLPPQPQE